LATCLPRGVAVEAEADQVRFQAIWHGLVRTDLLR
jgi:hypothetical protein